MVLVRRREEDVFVQAVRALLHGYEDRPWSQGAALAS